VLAAEPLGNDPSPYRNYWNVDDPRIFEIGAPQVTAMTTNPNPSH
jgi:hypothetical protein